MINHCITAENFTDVIASICIKENTIATVYTCKLQVIAQRLSDNVKK
jgi:hypothetical protein